MFQAKDRVECTLVEQDLQLCATICHTDGQRLLIEVDSHGAQHIVPGQAIHLVQSTPGGLYRIVTQVVNRRDNLFVVTVRTPQLMQRRRGQRARCNIPALYGRDLTLSALSQLDPSEAQQGQIVDMSQGGLKMVTDEFICTNVLIGISFPLTDNEGQEGSMNAEASVVRCNLIDRKKAKEEGKQKYAVAVKFTLMTRIDQIRLQKFLGMNP